MIAAARRPRERYGRRHDRHCRPAQRCYRRRDSSTRHFSKQSLVDGRVAVRLVDRQTSSARVHVSSKRIPTKREHLRHAAALLRPTCRGREKHATTTVILGPGCVVRDESNAVGTHNQTTGLPTQLLRHEIRRGVLSCRHLSGQVRAPPRQHPGAQLADHGGVVGLRVVAAVEVPEPGSRRRRRSRRSRQCVHVRACRLAHKSQRRGVVEERGDQRRGRGREVAAQDGS
mmetsp:Transcript_14251/g.37752  ORF Transcript_14251/g.37752 Transcript_14251/m.37752 type:complete len:229 (+) Transcript_14251:596-1282(+)